MDKQVANVQLMQKMNRLKVVNFVRRNPDASRPLISQKTGLSLASVTNITGYLLERGLLKECGTEKVGRVGRKSTLLRFAANSYNFICVQLNEKYMSVARTDMEGKVLEKIKVETENLSPEEVTAELCDNIKALLVGDNLPRVLAIGIAISGLILNDGRFIFSSRLKWKAFDIRAAIERETSIPVFVNNISLLKAVWYFSKSAYDTSDNMIYVDMENGIGAVQYVNSAILRQTLGEIGHTTVKCDGEQCFCGNRGCLEAMCSPARMLSLYKKEGGSPDATLSDVDKSYKKEAKSAIYAVSECGKYLGIGLANLVNTFNPSVLVINAGDFEDCPSVIIEAEKELKKRAFPSLVQKISIKQIEKNTEDTILGMAFDLCDRILDISYSDNIVE